MALQHFSFLCSLIQYVCVPKCLRFSYIQHKLLSSTLCWKVKLKFAVSTWIFSLCLLPEKHPCFLHIFRIQDAEEKLKVSDFFTSEFWKNLGVSVLGIGPYSVSVEEIQLPRSSRRAVGSWCLGSCFQAGQRLRGWPFHIQLYPWKPLLRGCVLPSLNTAE